jgi:hypothetical protein
MRTPTATLPANTSSICASCLDPDGSSLRTPSSKAREDKHECYVLARRAKTHSVHPQGASFPSTRTGFRTYKPNPTSTGKPFRDPRQHQNWKLPLENPVFAMNIAENSPSAPQFKPGLYHRSLHAARRTCRLSRTNGSIRSTFQNIT